MTLENLLAIHRLQLFDVTPDGLQRLLASAERNLTDARLPELSADNRFDTAAAPSPSPQQEPQPEEAASQ